MQEKGFLSDNKTEQIHINDINDTDIIETKIAKNYKIIGVFFDTYIVLQFEDYIMLIDQHAGHERVLFDNIRKANKQHVPFVNYLRDERFSDYKLYHNNADFLNARGRKLFTDVLVKDTIKIA